MRLTRSSTRIVVMCWVNQHLVRLTRGILCFFLCRIDVRAEYRFFCLKDPNLFVFFSVFISVCFSLLVLLFYFASSFPFFFFYDFRFLSRIYFSVVSRSLSLFPSKGLRFFFKESEGE